MTTTAPDDLRGTRHEIVDAAVRCFERYGPQRTSMRDIAEEAGISRRTLYRVFDDRSALIEEIRRTLDDEARWALMRRLQRRIHDEQPYLFLFDYPVKFAVAKRIRGFKAYGLQPGYSLRDRYLVDP